MSPPPFRAAVTGATGFIGAAVIAELVRNGIPAVAIVRPESNRARLARLSGYREVTALGWDEPGLVQALRAEAPTAFIHCAWRGVAGRDRNVPFQAVENLPLTLASVRLAHAAGCGHWIGLGSQAEYGNPNRKLDESAPTQPTTLYGMAKLAAGLAALELCRSWGMTGSWLRVFSTYGPGDAPHWFIPYVIRELAAQRAPELTACEQRWDFLHVADAARAVVAVAERRAAGVFNLGSGAALPLREVVEAIVAALGTDVRPLYGAIPYRPDQVMHLEADIARLRAATGWRPEVALADGLRQCIDFEPAAPEPGIGCTPCAPGRAGSAART